jgi:hypothetical protein
VVGHQGHCSVEVAVRWAVPRPTADWTPNSENRSEREGQGILEYGTVVTTHEDETDIFYSGQQFGVQVVGIRAVDADRALESGELLLDVGNENEEVLRERHCISSWLVCSSVTVQPERPLAAVARG